MSIHQTQLGQELRIAIGEVMSVALVQVADEVIEALEQQGVPLPIFLQAFLTAACKKKLLTDRDIRLLEDAFGELESRFYKRHQ